MDSIPQLYICELRTEVSEARELVSCLLAAWLQSIPKTGSCQLGSSQPSTKEDTLQYTGSRYVPTGQKRGGMV